MIPNISPAVLLLSNEGFLLLFFLFCFVLFFKPYLVTLKLSPEW